jgi:hypothetical protein
LRVDATPALQTFTIKAKKIDAPEPKTSYIVVSTGSQTVKLPFSAISKAGGRNFFAIEFVMSEGHEENEGSVNEIDAHS